VKPENTSGERPDSDEHQRRYLELCWQARGSNVHEETLLATDYLNHINEIVMLLELIPDLPDCLEDCKAWRPLSYQEHFTQSGIADRDLAIEAYDYVPAEFRQPFELLVSEMNRLVALSVERLEQLLAEGDDDVLRLVASRASQNLQDLIGQASAVIHGHTEIIGQDRIDALMELG
jgi:hypothetical protein